MLVKFTEMGRFIRLSPHSGLQQISLTISNLPERLNLSKAHASFVSMLAPIPSSSEAHAYHGNLSSFPKFIQAPWPFQWKEALIPNNRQNA